LVDGLPRLGGRAGASVERERRRCGVGAGVLGLGIYGIARFAKRKSSRPAS